MRIFASRVRFPLHGAIARAVRRLEYRVTEGTSSVAEAVGIVCAGRARARAAGAVVLEGYRLGGDVLGLGRFHIRPPQIPSGVGVHRRLGGGRIVPLGEGFLSLALALPHRSALVGDVADVLAPEQVLNRAVRGLLGALERLGVRAHYPGRDVVTVDRRIIAGLTFDVDVDGATVVEMVLATERNYAVVTELVDRCDPTGVVPATVLGPEDGTSLAEVAGRGIELEGLVTLVAESTAERFGLRVEEVPPTAPTEAGVGTDDRTIDLRDTVDPSMRRARRPSMLGMMEAYVRMADDRIEAVRLGGDLIAPAYAVGELEQSLVGLCADREIIAEALTQRLAEVGGFVLGTSPEAMADVVTEAATS